MVACPATFFDCSDIAGRGLLCSLLSRFSGLRLEKDSVDCRNIRDIYFPPAYLLLFGGPACNIIDMRRTLDRGIGGRLRPMPVGKDCYTFWQSGGLVEKYGLQCRAHLCITYVCVPEVVRAISACQLMPGADVWLPIRRAL